MKKDNGGPAFPSKRRVYKAGYATDEFEPVDGMTLRDYFAAKAMQGMLAAPVNIASDQHMTARDAYTVADAMLAERAK